MPSIINNTKQNHEVYLVCRQHENELPAGDCNVVRTEVTDSYATEGNYLLLAGQKANVAQGIWFIAAAKAPDIPSCTIVAGAQQVGVNNINLWGS